MKWTVSKLLSFKNHFGLTDKEIAAALGITPNMMWKINNGVAPIDKFESRLNGYLEAVRAGKIQEALMMIKYWESF